MSLTKAFTQVSKVGSYDSPTSTFARASFSSFTPVDCSVSLPVPFRETLFAARIRHGVYPFSLPEVCSGKHMVQEREGERSGIPLRNTELCGSFVRATHGDYGQPGRTELLPDARRSWWRRASSLRSAAPRADVPKAQTSPTFRMSLVTL